MKRGKWSSHAIAIALAALLVMPVVAPSPAQADGATGTVEVDGRWGDFLRGVGCGIAVVGSLGLGPLAAAGAAVGCMILVVSAAEG
jgi:hypothetical protein